MDRSQTKPLLDASSVGKRAVLPPGTRIRFKRRIEEPATEDHPTFLLAEANSLGTIYEYTRNPCNDAQVAWPYSVVWDGYPDAYFRASEDDFRILEPGEVK